MIDFLISTQFEALGNHTVAEFAVGYLFGGALIIGAPGVFFFVVFNAALQRTKGAQIGYKDHKDYGDSSTYENGKMANYKPYKHWIVAADDPYGSN
tara:strand:+ start:1001 stop:1288 length:288 start_codon:yes stop_codon:yes gene_type:complete